MAKCGSKHAQAVVNPLFLHFQVIPTQPFNSKFHSMMPRHCALLIPTSTILESARRSPGFKGPGVARAESVWAASKPVNSEGPRACGMPACSELALVPLEKLTKNSPMFAEHSWWIIESSFVTSLEATKSCVDLIWKKLSLVPTSTNVNLPGSPLKTPQNASRGTLGQLCPALSRDSSNSQELNDFPRNVRNPTLKKLR